VEQILLGSFLGISFADDMKNRKVHNFLILCFMVLSFAFFALNKSLLQIPYESLLLVSAAVLPLVYLRILGAGDYKLFMVIALFYQPGEMLNLMVISLIWNALAGSIKYLVNRYTKTSEGKESLKFPFTFGILLAWMSLAFIPQGGALW
jgi:Flp pilus assembly protein protease CpaA